jgi:hypothetical protein
MLIRWQAQVLTLQKLRLPPSFNVYLVTSKSKTAVVLETTSRHFIHNHLISDMGSSWLYRCNLT